MYPIVFFLSAPAVASGAKVRLVNAEYIIVNPGAVGIQAINGGVPPVDQSAEVAALIAENAQLKADLATCLAGNPPPPPTDTTEPVTILLSGPPATTTATSVTINVTATDDRPGPITYEAKIDGGAWAAFTPPLVTPATLADGAHEVMISALDASGLRDSSPLIVGWTQLPVIIVPPPPPAQGENVLEIVDGSSPGLARDEVYKIMIPWKNSGGDFTDANGTAQGTVPFATSATVAKGSTAATRVDATSLVKAFAAGEKIQMCVRGSAIMEYKSRSYGTEGPMLEVVYADGTPDLLAATADAECNPSTAVEMGGNPKLGLSYMGKFYVLFPALTKPVGKATLILTPYNIIENGRVTLYKFAVHLDKLSIITPYAPVANPFFTTEAFARDDLEPKGFLPTYYGIFGDPLNHPRPDDSWNQHAIVSDGQGGKAMQTTFDPRGSSALNASIPFPGYAEADEAEWSFEIKMGGDLLTGARDSFKLFAGITSCTKSDDLYFCGWSGAGPAAVGRFGTLLAGNGGSKSHGNDGHSMRWDAWKSPPPGHPMYGRFVPMQYCYNPEQTDFYGDVWTWNGQNTALVVETWHTVKMRAKINHPIPSVTIPGALDWPMNAEFDGWIDGVPCLRKRGFRLRTTLNPIIATPGAQGSFPYYGVQGTELAFGRIWLNSYHGGTSSPIARCSFQVRNMRVAKIA